jgi:hypothetical protein
VIDVFGRAEFFPHLCQACADMLIVRTLLQPPAALPEICVLTAEVRGRRAGFVQRENVSQKGKSAA